MFLRHPLETKRCFTFKDKLPKMLLSRLAVKYKRGGYIATYYGNIKGHFKVRTCEHLGISHLTGNPRIPLMLQLHSIF